MEDVKTKRQTAPAFIYRTRPEGTDSPVVIDPSAVRTKKTSSDCSGEERQPGSRLLVLTMK